MCSTLKCTCVHFCLRVNAYSSSERGCTPTHSGHFRFHGSWAVEYITALCYTQRTYLNEKLYTYSTKTVLRCTPLFWSTLKCTRVHFSRRKSAYSSSERWCTPANSGHFEFRISWAVEYNTAFCCTQSTYFNARLYTQFEWRYLVVLRFLWSTLNCLLSTECLLST